MNSQQLTQPLVFIIIIFISVAYSALSDCNNLDSSVSNKFSLAKQCIMQYEHDPELISDTLTTLRAIHELYVYDDINKNTGAPYSVSVDIQSGFDEIEGTTYESDYEAHEAIRSLIASVRDAHTIYSMPYCYAYWRFTLPFLAKFSHNGTHGKVVIIESSFTYIDEDYARVYPEMADYTSKFLNEEILEINGEDAYSVILDYADNVDTYSRDRGVRFNDALVKFFDRYLFQGPMPENEVVSFKIRRHNNEVVTINASYMATFFRDISDYGSFAAVCGDPYVSEGDKVIKKDIPFVEEFDNWGKKGFYPMEHKAFHTDELTKMLEKERVKKRNEKKRKREKNEKLSKEEEEEVLKMVESDLNIIYGTDEVKCFVKTDNSYGLLIVSSFSASDEQDYISTLVGCVTYFKTEGVEKVVVDVRGNGGGLVCNFYLLSKLLSNYIPEGLYIMSDLRNKEYFEEFYCPNNGVQYNFVNQNGKQMSNTEWIKGDYHTRGGIESQYSKLMGIDCSAFNYYYSDYTLKRNLGIEPENLIILTDGKCASACGFFVTLYKTLNLAKIISQGGVFGEEMALSTVKGAAVLNTQNLLSPSFSLLHFCPDIRYLIPHFPANQFATFAYLEHYHYDRFSLNDPTLVSNEVPMEYMKFKADAHYNNWNFDFNETIYDEIAQYFDSCFDWEIKKTETCNESPEIEHGIYGIPCSGGSFDSTSCVIKGCEVGYYLNEDKTECLEGMKEIDIYYLYVMDYIGSIIQSILVVIIPIVAVCCICCICCIIGIVVIIICCVNRLKESKSP